MNIDDVRTYECMKACKFCGGYCAVIEIDPTEDCSCRAYWGCREDEDVEKDDVRTEWGPIAHVVREWNDRNA
jgi:hypothetical protein